MSIWLEARRNERQIRRMQIDGNRRAEKRKTFYDSIRKDPAQFMQIHGRAYKIHTDKAIARAAEEKNIMRPWTVDRSIMIDRFDVRANLDYFTEAKRTKLEEESTEEKEEIVCDFERFRIPIINTCRHVDETTYLQKIAQAEYWTERETKAMNIQKEERERKKQISETKASYHFNYGDSEVVPGKDTNDEGNHDDEPEQDFQAMEDLDADFDVERLDAESIRRANKCGEAYGIKRSLFVNMLQADQLAARNAAELRSIERQKLALTGRESKHERIALRKRKHQLLGGKNLKEDAATTSLLSFVQAKDQEDERAKQLLAKVEETSSSSSEDESRPIFISSFGNVDIKFEEDEPLKKYVQGPELPSEQFRKILEMRHREDSPEILPSEERQASSSRAPRARSKSQERQGRRWKR
ncbi:unnamed protein product, partial [Mesorhabditis spiculigera]